MVQNPGVVGKNILYFTVACSVAWPFKGPFIFYEGRGAGGIWEAPFKNRMTPPQLTNFFTWPPLIAVIFWDDLPPKKKLNKQYLDFNFFNISLLSPYFTLLCSL